MKLNNFEQINIKGVRRICEHEYNAATSPKSLQLVFNKAAATVLAEQNYSAVSILINREQNTIALTKLSTPNNGATKVHYRPNGQALVANKSLLIAIYETLNLPFENTLRIKVEIIDDSTILLCLDDTEILPIKRNKSKKNQINDSDDLLDILNDAMYDIAMCDIAIKRRNKSTQKLINWLIDYGYEGSAMTLVECIQLYNNKHNKEV